MRRIAAMLLALALALPIAAAQPREDRLDRLHAELARSGDAAEAQSVAGRIWEIWLTAPTAEAQELLDSAIRAMRYGDYATSLAVLGRLTTLYPDYAEGWNQTATVLFLAGRDDDSLAAIDRVLALEPRHFGALAGRVMIEVRNGRQEAARAALDRALEVHPHLRERALVEPPPGEPL